MLFRAQRSSKALRARHLSRGARMAFPHFHRNPTEFLGQLAPYSPTGRTHCEVPPIERLSDLSIVQMPTPHVTSVYQQKQRLFGTSSFPSYMQSTLLGWIALTAKTPHPASWPEALGVTLEQPTFCLPSHLVAFRARYKPSNDLFRSAPMLLH